MDATPSAPVPIAVRRDRSRLDRQLHAFYFLSAGIRHFLGRRVRPAGLTLGAVFILACCLSAGRGSIAVNQLLSLTFGMIVIGIPWAFSRRARVEARRELPRFATAGEPLRYPVRVWNRSGRPLRRAWLSETVPDPRPDADEFTLLREPGEEERNAFDRWFAFFRWQWLLERRRMFTGGLSVSEVLVAPDAGSHAILELLPMRRGVVRFDDLRLLLPDPFGLFQRCRKIPCPPVTLTVLPKRYPLPPVELPGGAAFKISGEANTNTIGSSGEFVGLRDYRPGDPLRQIHWKSWARTGRPIVKELEDTHYPRFGLIVDTLSRNRTDGPFEEVISVAASFAASIDTNDSLLDLMFIKDEAHQVTAGRGVERAEKLLEVLAGVTPERTANFEPLARLVLRHRDDLTSCLVVFNGWDETRADFLAALRAGGVTCIPVIVGEGPAPAGLPGQWLECGAIGRDLQRLPPRLAIHL